MTADDERASQIVSTMPHGEKKVFRSPVWWDGGARMGQVERRKFWEIQPSHKSNMRRYCKVLILTCVARSWTDASRDGLLAASEGF